jgi:hypothetical protein
MRKVHFILVFPFLGLESGYGDRLIGDLGSSCIRKLTQGMDKPLFIVPVRVILSIMGPPALFPFKGTETDHLSQI